MTLSSGKHIEAEIDGIRCRVVEKGVSKPRIDFLQKLLVHNGLEVKSEELPKTEEDTSTTYIIGVTDITFNAVIKVYNRELKTLEGQKVTPDYWNQKTDEPDPNYWDLNKKDWF